MAGCGTIRCKTRSRKLHLTCVDYHTLHPVDTSARDGIWLKQCIIPSHYWPGCQWNSYCRSLCLRRYNDVHYASTGDINRTASRIAMTLSCGTTTILSYLGLHWRCCVTNTHQAICFHARIVSHCHCNTACRPSCIAFTCIHRHRSIMPIIIVEYVNEWCFHTGGKDMVDVTLLKHFALHTSRWLPASRNYSHFVRAFWK